VTGKELERYCEKLLAPTGGYWHRNEPKMQGRIRVSGGTADYTLILDGTAHYIECKAIASRGAFPLGSLTMPENGAKPGPGITPTQAAALDHLERSGGRGWVLAALGDYEPVRVPWRVWRGWLASGLRSVPPLMLIAAGDAAWQEGRLPGNRP